MKTGQNFFALLLLAGVVFGVTFISMNVSTDDGASSDEKAGKPKDGDESAPQDGTLRLTFASLSYPQGIAADKLPPASEFYRDEHHDFWFENENGETVRLGIKRLGCTCSSAEMHFVPNRWREQLVDAGLLPTKSKKQPSFVDTLLRPLSAHLLAEKAARTATKERLVVENKDGIVIEPGTIGFVRLTWNGKPEKSDAYRNLNLTAELWMQRPGSNLANLSVRTSLVPAVRVDETQKDVGVMAPNDERRQEFLFWSATRPSFDLQVSVEGEEEPASADDVRLVSVIKERLSSAERLNRKPHVVPPVDIANGYRVTVIVRERAKRSDRRLPQGPFTRALTVAAIDADGKPIVVRGQGPEPHKLTFPLEIHGEVSGDFLIVSERIRGRIDFGAFNYDTGRAREALISTRIRDAQFKVTIDKVPFFLKNNVTITEVPAKSGQNWKMSLRVPAKLRGFGGKFPRDEKDYRDSAVHLRFESAGRTQALRIPVKGIAQRRY